MHTCGTAHKRQGELGEGLSAPAYRMAHPPSRAILARPVLRGTTHARANGDDAPRERHETDQAHTRIIPLHIQRSPRQGTAVEAVTGAFDQGHIARCARSLGQSRRSARLIHRGDRPAGLFPATRDGFPGALDMHLETPALARRRQRSARCSNGQCGTVFLRVNGTHVRKAPRRVEEFLTLNPAGQPGCAGCAYHPFPHALLHLLHTAWSREASIARLADQTMCLPADRPLPSSDLHDDQRLISLCHVRGRACRKAEEDPAPGDAHAACQRYARQTGPGGPGSWSDDRWLTPASLLTVVVSSRTPRASSAETRHSCSISSCSRLVVGTHSPHLHLAVIGSIPWGHDLHTISSQGCQSPNPVVGPAYAPGSLSHRTDDHPFVPFPCAGLLSYPAFPNVSCRRPD